MDNAKGRGDRGKDKVARKRRSNAEINRDKARARTLADQARKNNSDAFARSGIIIPAAPLQDQVSTIDSADPTVDPAPPVSEVPTREEYDEIEIDHDSFYGEDGDDDDTGDFF